MSEPDAVHRGGMRWIAEELKKRGTGGDTEMVHMNKREMALLERVLDRKAKKNPHTGLPSFDEGEGSSGGQGDPAGGGGAGSSGQGTGGTGNGGETGGGANAPGTGGNIGNNPSGVGNPDSAAQSGTTPGVTGVGFLDTMLQGFLSHPIQSVLDTLFGAVPFAGQINSAIGLGNQITGAKAPTFGSAATAAGRAIGDAFSGSGGFSGTGGTGPSPTGGAGGSEGGGGLGSAAGPGAVTNPLTGGTTNNAIAGAGGVGNTALGGGSSSGGWDPRVVALLSQVGGKPGVNLGL